MQGAFAGITASRSICTCTGGNGVGDEDSADFIIRSPVWDTYHPIEMYVTPFRLRAPRIVGAGDPVHLQIDNWAYWEYDRRVGADIKTPRDSLFPVWCLPSGFTGVSTEHELTVTASHTAQNNALVSVAIDAMRRLPSPPTSGVHATIPLSHWSPFP